MTKMCSDQVPFTLHALFTNGKKEEKCQDLGRHKDSCVINLEMRTYQDTQKVFVHSCDTVD